MKRLIMCEGPNEVAIMRILIEHDKLIFGEDDLLGLTPFHARQIRTNAQVRIELNMYPGNDVLVMRVGDVQNEKLDIPKDYKEKICGVEKYCTKPELEMLLIISEDLVSEYEKVKSSMTPKEYAKQHIKYGRVRYNNSTAFFKEYYEDRIGLLVETIREYKRIKGAHRKDELCLKCLKIGNVYQQIVIKSEKALNALHFQGADKLDATKIQEYKDAVAREEEKFQQEFARIVGD